jgi:hypothetical protein
MIYKKRVKKFLRIDSIWDKFKIRIKNWVWMLCLYYNSNVIYFYLPKMFILREENESKRLK